MVDDEGRRRSLTELAGLYGESSVPPVVLATLITAQHLRPPKFFPLLVPPVLLFSSYLNLLGDATDAAGLSSAWSGLYLVMARRRKQALLNKWSPRGVVRGATMGLCLVNLVCGGLVFGSGKMKGSNDDDD
ncbi:MAG: hypothetical protein M1815_003750 [Lichina confinis]|nr:MAG: hypothetical protein M1815_003750 [Lichina confinis]